MADRQNDLQGPRWLKSELHVRPAGLPASIMKAQFIKTKLHTVEDPKHSRKLHFRAVPKVEQQESPDNIGSFTGYSFLQLVLAWKRARIGRSGLLPFVHVQALLSSSSAFGIVALKHLAIRSCL